MSKKDDIIRNLAKKSADSIYKKYREDIRNAMLGTYLREEAQEAQRSAEEFDDERTTLWDVVTSNVKSFFDRSDDNLVGNTKQQLAPKSFDDWKRDRERLAELKAEAEEKQQISAAYHAQKRQERADALTLDELDRKINAPGADNDPAIGEYRKAYDRKKSKAETENLPEEVLSLLDEYNNADSQRVANAFSAAVASASGGMSFGSAGGEQERIGKELERLGYSNYKELAAYRAYALSQEENSYDKMQEEYWTDYAKEHPVMASLSARGMAPVANIAGAAGYINNATTENPLKTGNINKPEFAVSKAKRAIDQTVSQSFEDGIIDKNSKAFLYQEAMSGIDSLGASLLRKAGGPLLGAGALTDKYIESIENGATQEQAFWSGAAAGIAESLFESFSLAKLNALKEIPPKSVRDIVKNIAKSMFTNFSEEANTEIANIVSDYFLGGGISDYAQQYQAYKDGGFSDSEAKKRAKFDMVKRIGEAGLGGALMGGVFGAVGSAAGKVNHEQALWRKGTEISQNGGVESLLASAYELGSDDSYEMSGSVQSVEQNMKALEQSRAEFEEKLAKSKESGAGTDEKGKTTEKAPEYTKEQYKEIGRLEEEIANQAQSIVKTKAESAIGNRLSQLGESDASVKGAAKAITKSVTGESLTVKDKNEIKNSKYGQRVLNEISDARNGNSQYASKWAGQLLDEIEGVLNSVSSPDIEAYRSRNGEKRTAQNGVFSPEDTGSAVDSVQMSDAARETMNTLIEKGQDREAFERSFKAYYQMGKSGYTVEDAMNSKGASASADFTDFQKESAFKLGQAALRVQQQVKLQRISKIDENRIIAVDENGKEVNLEEADADGGIKRLYFSAAMLRDVDAANSFIAGYKTGVPLMKYSDSFRSFFNAGKQNAKTSFKSFLNVHSEYKSLFSAIGEETAKTAFERGAEIANGPEQKSVTKPKAAKKKKGSFVNNTTSKQLDEVYEAVSKKLGIEIEKEQSLRASDGREANAQFLVREMKVLISADAQSEFTDTVHELGHLGEVTNKSAMQKVRQALLDWHNEVKGFNSTEEAISRFEQAYDCSREDAIEEYTNEALSGLFSTDEGVKDFLSWLEDESGYTKKEKKTVLQKIIELFDRIVEAIKSTIADGQLSFAAKEFAQMEADRAAEIRKMFLDALDGTDTQSKTAPDIVKNSIKKTQNMDYDEQIEKIFSKQFGRSDSLYIGKPSENLIKAGFSNAPFAMNQSDIRKSHEASAKNKNYSRHGVSIRFFEQMPERLNNAVMFIKNKNGTTVITDYQMNDRGGEKSYVVAGIWHNQKMESDTVNQVKSIYPLEDFKSQILRSAKNGMLVITDKKKAQAMLATVGVQPSEVSRLLELSEGSIAQAAADVNTKNSIKLTDSEGNNEYLRTGNIGISDVTDTDTKSSLRHSLGIIDENPANQSLIAQNEAFRRIISEQQHVLNRHFVDSKKVRTLARVIKEDYRSAINLDELTDKLSEAFGIMAESKTVSSDVVTTQMRSIAEDVVSMSKNLTEPSETDKQIIKDIRSVAVRLSDRQKAETANYYGSYNEFRKSAFGSLKIRNDGIELDSRYAELAQAYPDLFNPDVPDVDQPLILLEAVRALKNGYNDENGFDYDSAVDFLAAELYEKYFEIPDSKSLEDDYLVKLNREKLRMRKELQTAKEKNRERFEEELKRVRADSALHLSGIREQYDKKYLKNRARYEQRVKAIADTSARESSRKAIIRKVKRLSNLLLKTSNKSGYVGERDGEKYVIYNNIPEALRAPVATLCELFTEYNSVFEKSKLDDLKSSYSTIRANSPEEESSLSGLYDVEIEESLEKLRKTIAGKRLSQLTSGQLNTVRNVLDHFDAMIKNETEIFVNGRAQYVTDLGSKALKQLQAKGKKKLRQLGKFEGTADTVRSFSVNNYKAIYFFDKIGGVFKDLFSDVRKGQDKYVRNIVPAKSFYESQRKKYGADKWLRDNEAKKIRTERDETLELTLQQRLLIYATAKREQLSGQESLHLMTGGVVFENQIKESEEKTKPWKYRDNDAGAHPLSLGDIMKISDSLTQEQKDFADSLVGYLSKDMAALGNEVSMKLYGYRKFTEKYYIPFNSANSFGYQKFGEQGESLLKSMSFTKQTVRGAATPLVLSDFTEVWARHVEKMSAYNAMVIPLENLSRIFNYKTITDETNIGASVASQIETAFGREYKSYIVQFVKDVNGNVMTDGREDGYNALLRKFKKSAVFASASVAIQQPSAIMRAFSLIDSRYFVASAFDSRKSYEECKKYAPVALLKEIGGFDTVSGRNMIDYILKDEYAAKEKPAAFFKDSEYRDEVLSYLPGKADELTWAHIWNACKREQKAKTGLRGEALLEKAGERFSEVIERTQVYDSVLTRSGNMRSKSAAMQMLTAFMSEPTTTYNMLLDSWENRKEQPKKFVRTVAAVTSATLLNSVLKSMITAARDDDEDKTTIEKYIAQVVSNFLDDMNPFSIVPIFRDILSLMKGYDVSRSDMDLFSGFIKAIQNCQNENVPLDKKITGVVGAFADFLGIPLKNIFRDAYSARTFARDISSESRTTEKGIRFALEDEMFPILRAFKIVEPSSKQERLYEAWLDKDEETYRRLAAGYKSGTAVKNALIESIKKDYSDGIITAEQAERLLKPFFTDENGAYYKVREWESPADNKESDSGNDTDSGFYELETANVREKPKEESKKVENALSKYTQSDEEEDEEDEEAKAKYKYLESAFREGEASSVRREIADLKKHGISDEIIAVQVRKYLRNYDSKVREAGEAYADGNISALDCASEIAKKYGIEQFTVESAIRSVSSVKTNKSSVVTGTSAIMSDVYVAVAAGNSEESSRLVREIVAGKIAEGKTTKEAYSSVRSSLNGKWRDIYLAASSTERAEIRRNLYNTGAYESIYKLDATIRHWIENQAKKG